MTEKSKTIIKEEMLSLSKEAQEAINTFAWEKISEEIGKKYLLSEDEINIFQLETACFLLGLVDGDSYPTNIEDEVGTSKEEASKIAEEVFQKIFTPINDAFVENIKKSEKVKNSNPKQTIDFILSGGDYATFAAPNSPLDLTPPSAPLSETRRGAGGEVSPPRPGATPQEGNNIPIKPEATSAESSGGPKKMTDIKVNP